MKKIFIFTFLLLLVACAPAPVPATATPALTLTPTRTPTLTPTATITPTPTPSLLPSVSAVLEGQKYTVTEGDKIVSDSGETLFRFVPEADRVSPEAEWQRMITFTTTDNEKIEMPRFETFDDALKYISQHAYWRTGSDWMKQLNFWTSFDNPNGNDLFALLKKIPRRSPYKGLTSPNGSEKFILLNLSKIRDNSFIIFEPYKDNFEIVYVDEKAEAFREGNHSVPTPQP